MKIALSQIDSTTGDLKGNVEKISREIEKAKEKQADLIVFPEMAITGYCVSDLVDDDTFVKENKRVLELLAQHIWGIAAVIGFVDYDKNKNNGSGKMVKYNAAAVIQDKKIRGIVHKTLLPNYGVFDDKRFFHPGEERKVIPINTKKGKLNLGISICEDMWDENYDIKPIPELVEKGADILINMNASPFTPTKIFQRHRIIKRHIKEHGKPFLYVNTSGIGDIGKNIIPFDGQSFACDSKGSLIAIAKKFEEDSILIDLERIEEAPITLPKINREKELYEALVISLREYAKKTGFSKAIVPVSGGIDSALGLVLTVEAFGKENVVAYNLPSKFNSSTTRSIAEKLSKNLGVKYKIITIQEIDNLIRKVYEESARAIEREVTKENIHARIRGLLMMIESNDTGALLISNGNKTEIALGYSTLYGDMCGGVSIIGDLSKIDVYKVARYANKKFKREIIPEETFKIKPSAELSEGQVDPFDYSVVSPIVTELVEERKGPSEIIEDFKRRRLNKERFIKDPEGKTVYDKHTEKSFTELVYKTHSLLRRSVHKRLQGPPIFVVTESAFGFDRRETLINRWEG